MSPASLPTEVAQFIQQRLDSVGHLEALLLLFRSGEQRWDAAAVSRRLYVDEANAEAILQRLLELGLLQRQEQLFYFAPADATHRAHVEALARLYSTHLIPITSIIHLKAASRRVQEFAEAFNFRRPK